MTIEITTQKGQRIHLTGESVPAAIKQAKPLIPEGDAIKSVTTAQNAAN